MSGVRDALYLFLEQPHAILTDPQNIFDTLVNAVSTILWLLLVPVILLVAAAIASSLVQHPLVFSTDKMKPKLSKISILKGAKQKFSLRQIVDFAKGIIKVCLVATVAVYLIWPEKSTLPFVFSPPWHFRQERFKTGKTSSSNLPAKRKTGIKTKKMASEDFILTQILG